MGKALLMVAFHFPPAAMGSGHLRTLGFARHLPERGWDPIILSACPSAFPRTSPISGGQIPTGCVVRRALALDAGRHLAIAGKYPGFIAQPDRWASWWPAAVIHGLGLIRKYRIRAIWSTYPIMTAHHIAYTLSRLSQLPWIADFRDPVSGSVSSENHCAVASQYRWEKRVVRYAARVTFTTSRACDEYARRYPDGRASGRFVVIENGYEEADFIGLPSAPVPKNRPLVFVHSGLLYTDGRDPMPFFEAVSMLKRIGNLRSSSVRIILRACGSEDYYARALERLDISDLVSLAPPVTNRAALEEQATADGLLLFQGARFDQQIPAKLYEYLRIGRPILALVSHAGATAETLRRTGAAALVAIDDAEAISRSLLEFIHAIREDRAAHGDRSRVASWSRQWQTATLAHVLEGVTT